MMNSVTCAQEFADALELVGGLSLDCEPVVVVYLPPLTVQRLHRRYPDRQEFASFADIPESFIADVVQLAHRSAAGAL